MLLGGVALSSCKLPAYAAYRPVDAQSKPVFELWSALVTAGLIIGAFVTGLIVWAAVRYRVREDDTAVPHQTHENVPWEVAYTITPVVLVAIIFGFTMIAENHVDFLSKKTPVQVHVIAYRWGWIFDYQHTSVSIHTTATSYPTLVLPKGETAQITLTSADVVHEFYVPNFLFGRYAQPGVTNRFDFTPTTMGTYLGHCDVYCGLYHAEMLFYVHVVSPSSYGHWLTSHNSKVHAA